MQWLYFIKSEERKASVLVENSRLLFFSANACPAGRNILYLQEVHIIQ